MSESALLAFGGNDRASRSARAKLQWRDRYGKFIEMGRGIKFKVNLPNIPNPVSVVGKFVGSTNNPDVGQVYVSGHPSGLPDGFYNVKSSNAAETVANLSNDQLARNGINLGRDAGGNVVSSRTAKDVQSLADLQYSPYPLGWSKRDDGSIGTQDNSFSVKDAGKSMGLALYHNNSFVGYYNHQGWDDILTKADQLDEQESAKETAAANPQEPTTPVEHAKAAIKRYDLAGGEDMLRQGYKPAQIIAYLNRNSPKYNQDRQLAGDPSSKGDEARAALKNLSDRLNAISATDKNGAPVSIVNRGKSRDGVDIPKAPNLTNDTTKYTVPSDQAPGSPRGAAQLNRTEKDIYDARKEIVRRQALVDSAQTGVDRADGMVGANPNVIARRQAAADKNLAAQKASLAEAQAHLDKLEKGTPIQEKTPDQPNNDANSNIVDAQAPAIPSPAPDMGDDEAETPLIANDNTALSNVSTPRVLNPEPHTPEMQDAKGVTDDPKVIAQDFNKADLQDAFSEAIGSGDADVRLQFPNGTATSVPVESVRDALQYQGHDTNADTNPDPQITTQDALDALPTGSKVQRGTTLLTKNDEGLWASPKGGIYQNLMQTSNDNNLKLMLVDNAGDKNAPSVAAPATKTDTAPAPDAGPTFKNARELVRGDEVSNGTILNVWRGTRTPKSKVDVQYLDNRGQVRNAQWNAGTRIGIVKRPARALPGDNKAADTTPTPAPAPKAPDAPKPTETPAPAVEAVLPPTVSTDANNVAVKVPNAPAAKPTPAAKDDVPVTKKELAKHLAKTRIAPTDDPFLAMAIDDVNNNPDPSALAIAYVNDKLKDAPKIAAPTPKATDAPAAPAAKPAPAAPAAPATPDAPAVPTPQAPQTPSAGKMLPNGGNIFDADLVLAEVRQAYPNHKELKNGDLVLGSREVTGPKGARKRYDMVVTRTGNEYFYTYIRETDLTDGTAKSQRFGPMVHSAKALDTRIQVGLQQVNDKRVSTWFSSRARRPFVKEDDFNPATGEREHLKEQPIPDTTISAIHASVNDKQVTDDVIRNVYDTISTLGASKATRAKIAMQYNLPPDKLNSLIDAINVHVSSQNAKKNFQVWVSSDGLTPLFEGDLVVHRSGRTGRIASRIVDHGTKGYGYPDYVFFQEIDANGNEVGNQRNMTSRFMTIIRTAQGTDGSERIGANAVQLPAPVPSTRAQNRQNAMRAARQKVTPPTPNQQVQVNSTDPTKPTVNVNGTDHNVNLTRTHTTQNDTPVSVPAGQVQPNDLVQIYDPTADKNRLGQVITVQPTQDGNTTVTSIVPDDQNINLATVVTTNVPGTGDDSQGVAVLRPTLSDDPNAPATQADLDRLNLTYNKVALNTSTLDDQAALDVLRTLLSDGDGKSKSDIDKMIVGLEAVPATNDGSGSINSNASLVAAVDVAQAIADDHPQTTDLQNAITDAVITADSVSTPHGRVQGIIDENAKVTDLSAYRNVAMAKGSTPGGTFRDPATGDRVYLKFQKSQARVDNEALASALYRAVGRDAVTVLRGKRDNDNRPISYSPMMEFSQTKTLRSQLRYKGFSSKVRQGFAVDAWLANWDGTLNNNISVDLNGDPVHVDLGGAIRFRAKGQLRPNFGDKVLELDTLTNGVNREQFAAYGRMTDDEKKKSAEQLLNIDDAEIDALTKNITSTSMTPAESQALADTLKARRKDILNTYGIQDTQTIQPAAQAPAAPTQAPTPTGGAYDPATIAAANPNSDPNVQWGNAKAAAKGIPLMSGYEVKVDADGTHYVDSWKPGDSSLIRKGQLAVPALPFKMDSKKEGDTHFYDSSGTRRWGALGAAGAMIRRKNADGSYSFLMAQRGSSLSTDPNTWSIITGANSNHVDAADPTRTALKELGEEVKVSDKDIKHTHNLDVDVDPKWKFTYSFFDLDPAAAAKYANVKVRQTREIQKIGWVSEAELLQFSKDGKLHSAFSPQVVADIKKLSDQNGYAFGSNGAPATPVAAPATPAVPTPAIPDPTPAAPEPAQAAPEVPGAYPDGRGLSPTDLDNAVAGQKVYYLRNQDDNGDDSKNPRDAIEYTKAEDGTWFNSKWEGVSRKEGETLNGLSNADGTQTLKVLAEPSTDGTQNIVAGPMPVDIPTYTPKADGEKADAAWEYSAPEGSVAHYDNGSGIRIQYVKNANNGWDISESTPNVPEAFAGRRVHSRVGNGDIVVGPLAASTVPQGEKIDDVWVKASKPGAQLAFRNPITGGFQTLNKINAKEWTDGQNVFTNEAVIKLRRGGRTPLYSGPAPDVDSSAGRGTKMRSRDMLDALQPGEKISFTRQGFAYTAQKQTNGDWLAKRDDGNGPSSSWDMFTDQEHSSRTLFYQVDDIRRGERLSDAENDSLVSIPYSEARKALAVNLPKVDPEQHVAASAPLGFMSDDNITAMNNAIGAATNNFTTALDRNTADAIIDKFRPEAPKDVQGWLALADGLALEVQGLRVLAGERDQQRGADNLEHAHGNYVLAAISSLRGFDKKPTQLNKTDRSSFGPGILKTYRGVKGFRDRTPKQLLDQFRYGDTLFAGTGVYGNGTYLSTYKITAKGYSHRYETDNMIAVGLPIDDMKIFEYTDPGTYHSNHEKVSDEFKSEMEKFLTAKGMTVGSDEYEKEYKRIYRLFTEVNRKGNDRKRGSRIDVGVWAAMLGYDALRKRQGMTTTRDPNAIGANNKSEEVYYILLNRGKAIIGNGK